MVVPITSTHLSGILSRTLPSLWRVSWSARTVAHKAQVLRSTTAYEYRWRGTALPIPEHHGHLVSVGPYRRTPSILPLVYFLHILCIVILILGMPLQRSHKHTRARRPDKYASTEHPYPHEESHLMGHLKPPYGRHIMYQHNLWGACGNSRQLTLTIISIIPEDCRE